MNNIEKLELAIANKEKYCILVFNRALNASDYKIKGYTVTQILDDMGNILEISVIVENMSEYLEFLKSTDDEIKEASIDKPTSIEDIIDIVLPESVTELNPSENVEILEPIKRKKSNLNKNM